MAMKCPYCNEEMESGYIKSSHFIHWGKEKELGLLLDDIKLSPNGLKEGIKSFFEGHFVEAYRCSGCNKIIIELEP